MEAILATDMSGGLSKEGKIPWKSQKDMRFFYQTTKNNIVIMGRNTYFSLPENIRPLKNRLNIVLTKDPYKYMNDYKNIPELIFTDDDNIHLYIQKYREQKEQGKSDRTAELFAEGEASIVNLKRFVINCRYNKDRLYSHLQALNAAREDAHNRGHMLRKEMDKLNMDIAER
jgi:hypothetical protein